MRRLYHYEGQKTQDQRSVHKMYETDVSGGMYKILKETRRKQTTLILIGGLPRLQSGMIGMLAEGTLSIAQHPML